MHVRMAYAVVVHRHDSLSARSGGGHCNRRAACTFGMPVWYSVAARRMLFWYYCGSQLLPSLIAGSNCPNADTALNE